MQLAGKRALVTGASHGIGKAIALAFAREGADVAFTFRSRDEGARDTERQIAALGRRVSVRHAEMTDLDKLSGVVDDAIASLGGLDILVNNAGGGRGTKLIDLTIDDWRYTLDLCVTAPFVLGQSAARRMAQIKSMYFFQPHAPVSEWRKIGSVERRLFLRQTYDAARAETFTLPNI